MFTVIYSFNVNPERVDLFINAWKEYTTIIYENAGSLGSRLHKQSEFTYIAYAQWPDKQTWERAGDKLPSNANNIGVTMKHSCEKNERLCMNLMWLKIS